MELEYFKNKDVEGLHALQDICKEIPDPKGIERIQNLINILNEEENEALKEQEMGL